MLLVIVGQSFIAGGLLLFAINPKVDSFIYIGSIMYFFGYSLGIGNFIISSIGTFVYVFIP